MKVRMQLREKSYDIQIGARAIRELPKWVSRFPSKRAFLVSDEKLTEARAETKASLARGGWEVHEILVKAGEGLKELESVVALYGELSASKANRDSVLFALGGGSVGDAAGFVAATFLRGISWVGLPTTLLAQVDSSVGGKTGINLPSGKNLVGSFHQPKLVVCDTQFLKTLGPREIVSGFGEVVKYGITFDPKFYSFLETKAEDFLSQEPEVLAKAIRDSVRWKCKIVSKDEEDRKGSREILNFGHTFAHALESVTRYEVFQHGEAVIWGMRFALALSQIRKKLSPAARQKIDSFLSRLSVPEIPPEISPGELFSRMSQDKKIRGGKIHFVLLKSLGKTVSDNQVKEQDLHQAFRLMNGGGA